MTRLREILLMPDLSPFHNNVIASQIMVLYFKLALEGLAWMRVRFGMHGYAKQFLYMMLASNVVFWPLFDPTDWSWRLNAVVPAAMLTRFVYKGAILKDAEDIEVQTLSIASSPSELLFGPVQFTAVMLYIGLYCFMTEEAAVLAAAVGIGDAMAPMIGSVFGRHVYQMPFASPKTMEGSIVGIFLGTVSATYTYLYMMGIPLLPLRMILAYGGIAAVAEGTAPGNLDNLLVPVVIHFSIDRVQQWLPA